MSKAPWGIVLAGGRASRMGGGDKSLQKIGERPLLAHVIRVLKPQCQSLLLSANGDLRRFAAFGLPVINDDVPDFAGPLAGILAGLDWLAAHAPRSALALVAAADCPFLPKDLVARLIAARQGSDAVLACASSGGRIHPVVALWPIALRHDLRQALVTEGMRKVERFMSRYALAHADWPVQPFDPFFNVNTPADLVAAEAIWREAEGARGGL